MIDDDRKLKQKFKNKKVNASKENIRFELSFDDIIKLLEDAGIKSSHWSNDGYHLARYNDTGDYIYGNCRFISMEENIAERKTSEMMIKASVENIKKATPESKKLGLLRSKKWSDYVDRRKENASLNEAKKENLKHPSYKGTKNSQYGSSWYTNGVDNIKIKECDEIPDGYFKGRTLNRY